MKKELNNYAFIDSQNLNLGIQKLGWKLDYYKFRVYLAEKYGVKKAYIFIGFVALNQLVQHLYENNKLEIVLSPDEENCSSLLKQTAKEKIWFMNNLQDKLEYKKKSTA